MEDVRAVVTGFIWAWLAGLTALLAGTLGLRRAGRKGSRGLRWGTG